MDIRDIEIGTRTSVHLGTAHGECLGFLEYCEDGVKAFTADNNLLGMFENDEAAHHALDESDDPTTCAIFDRFLTAAPMPTAAMVAPLQGRPTRSLSRRNE